MFEQRLFTNMLNNRITSLDICTLLILIYDNNLKTSTDIERYLLTLYINTYYKKGYLYCLYNVMFNHYGENVYKLGCSHCPNKRLKSYVTTYLDGCEFKHISEKIKYHKIVEKILFKKLEQHRMRQNREFFQIDLDTVIKTITSIKLELINDNIYDLYIKYNIYIGKIDMLKQEVSKFVDMDNNKINNIINITNQPSRSNIKYIKNTDNIFPVSNLNSISKADNIDEITFNNLEIKYYNKLLSIKDMAKVEKHIIIKLFNVNTIDDNWLITNNNKMNIMFNYNLITNKMIIRDEIKSFITNRLLLMDMIKEVILILGLDFNFNIKLSKEIFEINYKNALNECELFKNFDYNMKLFRFDKTNIHSIKSFMGFINSVIKKYGIVIKLFRTNYRQNIGGQFKHITKCTYGLVYNIT
jgi:hypothetical protein